MHFRQMSAATDFSTGKGLRYAGWVSGLSVPAFVPVRVWEIVNQPCPTSRSLEVDIPVLAKTVRSCMQSLTTSGTARCSGT